MPQQGIAQNADANAQKSEQDQSDLEAATAQNLPSDKAADNCFDQMNVRKLTRAQKSKLVDQVLKVRCQDGYNTWNQAMFTWPNCASLVAASEHNHGPILLHRYSHGACYIDILFLVFFVMLQSRDADTETFLAGLKARMDRCILHKLLVILHCILL